ncbi:MAG: CHAT domain-containing protein [Cyanobacteria bacterium P01_A01_bin.84]
MQKFQPLQLLAKSTTKKVILFTLSCLLTITPSTFAKQPQNSPFLNSTQTIKSATTKPEKLLEQGKAQYLAGNLKQAIAILLQAANRYKASNQTQQQAIALINLSLAYQQLGSWQQADAVIKESLYLLTKVEKSEINSRIVAQALDVQGRMQFMRGQAENALITWKQAGEIYQKLGGLDAALIRNRINSAQALQALGRFLQSKKTLIEVKEKLAKQEDSRLKVVGLRKLGNVLQIVGDLKESEEILQQSLAIAKSSSLENEVSQTLFSLGNTARTGENIQAALKYYQQAQAATTQPVTRLQAQLNQLRLLVDNQKFSDASKLSAEIKSTINKLPASRIVVNTKINFARSLMKDKSENTEYIAKLLANALQQAQQLQDKRAESYASGTLGELYEKTRQFNDAQNLTKKALFTAQSINAPEIAYLWKWQIGRLYKQQGNIEQAISYYSGAVESLESLRENLVVVNPDIQFSFRESVEPVYRQLVELLLQTPDEVALNKSLKINSARIKQARQVLESLQVAELENFFRSSCLTPVEQIDFLVDKKDQTAAVVYAIILPESLNVILKLPNQNLRVYKTPIAQTKVQTTVEQLRDDLRDVTRKKRARRNSSQLYNWLIKPLETDLKNNGITNLVFVLESELQNIPMSVLYDEQNDEYLLEKYAISLTPGLQLVNPKPLKEVKLNALTAGLAEERTVNEITFNPLENVEQELQTIQSQVPKSTELLNDRFTKNNLQSKLKSSPFSVVHLATHGKFSSNPDETFILTWNKLLNVKEFDQLLRTSDSNTSTDIELLVLSACETAQGDKRAALGLAGIAVQAGARSTLATLWAVDDESTAELMSIFYSQLKAGTDKAEALQYAQKQLLAQGREPYFWAPYVLLGNWL